MLNEEKVLELEKYIIKFNQTEITNSYLDTSKNFTLATEFSDESNSDKEQNQSENLGKSVINKCSNINNMLEECGLNISPEDIKRAKYIKDSYLKKNSSNKSFSTHLPDPISDKLYRKVISTNSINTLNRHIPSSNGKRPDLVSNYPIKIINSKYRYERNLKHNNNDNFSSMVFHNFYRTATVVCYNFFL